MIEFPPPNSRALLIHLPRWISFCPDGSHLPRWGLILPRIPPPTPVLWSAVTKPLWWYVHTQITPKPTWTHPFPGFLGLNLKGCKMNYSLGNLDPNWAKWLKSGQNFFLHKLYCIFQKSMQKVGISYISYLFVIQQKYCNVTKISEFYSLGFDAIKRMLHSICCITFEDCSIQAFIIYI